MKPLKIRGSRAQNELRFDILEAQIKETNEEGLRLALDLIDEVRDEANAKIVEHQKKASFYYNLRVKERFFRQGDLVLRKIEASGVGQKSQADPKLGRTISR